MISNPPISPFRLFMAVDLPEECKQKIHGIQKILESVPADVKWVAPQNYHITLKFLGSILSARIETAKQILDECAQSLKSFKVMLDTAGAFPMVDKPDIIWIGQREESDNLKRAAGDLQTALSKEGFSIDTKPFHTHVTIGRSRSDRNHRELSAVIKTLNIEPIEISVSHLTIFQSTLSSDGPRYAELYRSPLK